MNDLQDPKHNEIRTLLQSVGPAIAGIGLLLTIVGFGSFFSSFGSFGPPRYFWCAFVGMPLLGVGLTISKFAYLGTIMRYMAGETAPVGKDLTNYMVAGTRDSIRDVATAVGEGFAVAGGVEGSKLLCQNCSAVNDRSANFCSDCGAQLVKSKRCEKCGELNDSDARFCDNCGTSVA